MEVTIERDWTNTDQADAADAEYDRKWWRRDSSLAPWPDDEDDEEPPCTDCGDTGISYQTEKRCACMGPEE